MTSVFKALSDPTRRRVLEMLRTGPKSAGELAEAFHVSKPTMSAHFAVLVNADLIAAGLSPFDPGAAAIRAGRVMLSEIDRHAAAGRSFAFETTLAGHTYMHRIGAWRSSRTPRARAPDGS